MARLDICPKNHRTEHLLTRIACADAYAAAAEFLDRKTEREAQLLQSLCRVDEEVGYQSHPRPNHTKRSQYTDDTEMSVANARVLLGEYPQTEEGFAQAYVDEHRFGGNRFGYARRFQDFMRSVKDGASFMRTIHRTGSCKNGAVMRAGVIGVLPDWEQVLDVSTMQASVTHFTACGILSSRIASFATYFMLRTDVAPRDLVHALWECEDELLNLPNDVVLCEHWNKASTHWHEPWSGSPVVGHEDESIAMTTIRAALTLATTKTSFVDMLRGAIEYGGDTDSVAAVAAAIMAPRSHEPLPAFFERDLEFGSPKTGAERLRALGTKLMDQFGLV